MANPVAVPQHYSPDRVSAAASDRRNISSASNFALHRHDSKTPPHKRDFQSLPVSHLWLQPSRGLRLRLRRLLAWPFRRWLRSSPAVVTSLAVTSSARAGVARRAYRNAPRQKELQARQPQIPPRVSGRPSRSQNSLLVSLRQNVSVKSAWNAL